MTYKEGSTPPAPPRFDFPMMSPCPLLGVPPPSMYTMLVVSRPDTVMKGFLFLSLKSKSGLYSPIQEGLGPSPQTPPPNLTCCGSNGTRLVEVKCAHSVGVRRHQSMLPLCVAPPILNIHPKRPHRPELKIRANLSLMGDPLPLGWEDLSGGTLVPIGVKNIGVHCTNSAWETRGDGIKAA